MVILNFFPVSMGGGLQNSLSFINVIRSHQVSFRFVIVCRRGSSIEAAAAQAGLPYVAFNGGLWGRIWFELWRGRKLCNEIGAKCVFSLFGNAPLSTPKSVRKVSGFAYSNIIQAEVDFWGWLPWYGRLKKRLVDSLRLFAALRSDIIILETDYLRIRAKNGVFRKKDVRVVKMAPSSLVVSMLSSLQRGFSVREENPNSEVRILYLSGAHPNKNIHFLAPLFLELSKLFGACSLITTLPEGKYLKMVEGEFVRLGIGHLHKNIGPVAPIDVARVLRESSAVVNVATLESFSNNWVEAWAAEVPLIVSDAPWAKSSCEGAAIYIDIHRPSDSAKIIHSVLSSRDETQGLVAQGRRVLTSLPTAEERTKEYLEIIESCLAGAI